MNVWDASIRRLHRAFDEFDNVIVAFSGGKDSGVMLNLARRVARERDRQLTILHVDYEGQYTATTEYVERTLTAARDETDVFWCCLPIEAQCSVSMFQDHWLPWEKAKRDLWVRDMPEMAVTEDNHLFDFEFHGISDYDFNIRFARWHHRQSGAERTMVLVGIREQESLHRHAAIHNKQKMFRDWKWTTSLGRGVFNGYPIHDWLTDDIWTANAREGWDYNRLYDLMYQAGVPIESMRVASPFNASATDSLKMYRMVEPAMWARLVGRVNGANFTAIYGGTRAMGWKDIRLPEGHTWKTYAEFLLSTLPDDIRNRYLVKFGSSIRYWTEGGALRTDLVDELRELQVEMEVLGPPTDKRRRNIPHEIVRFDDYPDDLDVSDYSAVPTYKRMCITILKNDYACKTMGFGQTKRELAKRKEAIDLWEKQL